MEERMDLKQRLADIAQQIKDGLITRAEGQKLKTRLLAAKKKGGR
jgi:hypothetical protein